MNDGAQVKYLCNECVPLNTGLWIVVSVVFGKVRLEQLVLCSPDIGVAEVLAECGCPGKILLFITEKCS